jgi:hypothetical protein
MRPLRYFINVTLDGCCDHRAMIADEDLHRHAAENLDQADALLFEISVNGQMVRIFILAILAFALCSCAELFRANPNALPDDYDYFGHTPGAGDPE